MKWLNAERELESKPKNAGHVLSIPTASDGVSRQVRVRERERECVCVCVHTHTHTHTHTQLIRGGGDGLILLASTPTLSLSRTHTHTHVTHTHRALVALGYFAINTDQVIDICVFTSTCRHMCLYFNV